MKAQSKDVLIVISTSGNSKNILKAIEQAKKIDYLRLDFLVTMEENVKKNRFITISLNQLLEYKKCTLDEIICDLVEN